MTSTRINPFRAARNALLYSLGLWVVIFLIAFTTCAHAEPAAFWGFCTRFPSECLSSKPASVSASQLFLIRTINARVNAETTYESDREHFGVADYWTLVLDSRGDCEDYALTKIHLLRLAGIPAGALALAEVKFWDGSLHVVALVQVDSEVYALDNDSENPFALFKSRSYWPISIQEFGHPSVWLTPEPEPILGFLFARN